MIGFTGCEPEASSHVWSSDWRLELVSAFNDLVFNFVRAGVPRKRRRTGVARPDPSCPLLALESDG
jgi:hypothetical protein